MADEEYDAIILGAGFGGIASLIRLRKLNFKVKVIEKAGDIGGTWYWNRYPGARVDSATPIYQLFDKDLWEDWSFKEHFPGQKEILAYFQHLNKKLDLKRDIQFNTACTGARFNTRDSKWTLQLDNGETARARFFILAVGFAAKPYVPAYPGFEKFTGIIHHTSAWPIENVNLEGKRIAVIGTGASGVQTIQECAPLAKQLTVYQRTPNYAIPMNQRLNSPDEIAHQKKDGRYEATFERCLNSFSGFDHQFQDKKTTDDTPEERKRLYETLLIKQGGFSFLLSNYQDILVDERANRELYDFWRTHVHSRAECPKKAELLAPVEPVHPFGAKRPCLEQNYYEAYNLAHVDLVNLNVDPIESFTEHGIRTKSGLQEFDVIVLATGFDSVTAPLAQLDIRGTNGETIAEHWQDGLKTAIGISLAGFPNMFFLYGPQAPTAFSNGPTCVQMQVAWIGKLIDELRRREMSRVEAKAEKEDEWTALTHAVWYGSLAPKAKSWYQGSNIPGKREEPLNFLGGFNVYTKALYDSLENNYQGWIIA